MAKLLKRITTAGAALFGYDAVEAKGRRKNIAPTNRGEDRELSPGQRYKLVASTRDITRNFAIAAWAVRKHLDYVSSFTFQATTGNKEVDNQIEALIRWRSRPVNCDVSRRHSLRRMIRMWEERRTIDGDVLIRRLADGKLQTFEADRIRDPQGNPAGVNMANVVHGIEVDPLTGRSLKYLISDRKPNSDTLNYSGSVDATFADLLAYYTRFDQIRGVSPLAPAINSLRDVYENFDYALAKAKVSQLFAMAVYREAQEPLGNVAETDTSTDDEPRYEIDFNRGPTLLDLDPGDKAEILESNQPSSQFQDFTTTMIGIGLKALDIPLSFYDEGRANFSSGRQAWILYEQSATQKRDDIREVLNNTTAYWLAGWILDGSLVLPKGTKLRDLSWEWIHAGIPWMDPLKEITADIAAVKAGLASRTRLLKERGQTYTDIIDELAAEQNYADAKGVALSAEAMDLAAQARNQITSNTIDATE